MNPKPIAARALIKLLDDESKIWLPDGACRTLRGAVVELGDDASHLRVADEVLFPQSEAIEFRIGDETLYVIQELAVLVVLDRVEQHAR